MAALRTGGPAAAVNDRYFIAVQNEDARRRAVTLLTANPQNIGHPDPQRPPPPVRPDLHSIQAPTLVMVEEHDIADIHASAGAL